MKVVEAGRYSGSGGLPVSAFGRLSNTVNPCAYANLPRVSAFHAALPLAILLAAGPVHAMTVTLADGTRVIPPDACTKPAVARRNADGWLLIRCAPAPADPWLILQPGCCPAPIVDRAKDGTVTGLRCR